MNEKEVYKDFEKRDYDGRKWLVDTGKCKFIRKVEGWRVYKLLDKYFALCELECGDLHNTYEEVRDIFEYDIYNCPKELKGQMKIGDFCG